MALLCHCQYSWYLLFMVVWVILTLLSRVDNLSTSSNSKDFIEVAEQNRLKRALNKDNPSQADQHSLPGKGQNNSIFNKASENSNLKISEQAYALKRINGLNINISATASPLCDEEQTKKKYPEPKCTSIVNNKNAQLNKTHPDNSLNGNFNQSDLRQHKYNSSTITLAKLLNQTQAMNRQPALTTTELPFNVSQTSNLEEDPQMHNLSHDESANCTTPNTRTVSSEEFTILLISAIVLVTILLLGLIGGSGYAIYRRRVWNKPQTLTDKSSNADSSGYIDDSTLRENSEEMYSLDNDSFLNSLEAMTIQNYWTDNLKHTKL